MMGVVLAERLGGRYCYSFIDRIFPALKQAQDSGDPADRLAFFESFYRVPSPVVQHSTRFLVRYLSEVMRWTTLRALASNLS